MTRKGIRHRDKLAAEMDETRDEAISKAREAGKIVKCLLVCCLKSKALFAQFVPQTSDDEDHYCAKFVSEDVCWFGDTKIISKSDNKTSILALKNRVARFLREYKDIENVQTENPARYDSQSNGGAEIGVKIVRGLFRSFKLWCTTRELEPRTF